MSDPLAVNTNPTVAATTRDANATTGLFSEETSRVATGAVSTRYVLGSEIARGGMGIVYRATDTVLNRAVAVKVLQDKYDSASTAAHRFADEAHITARLQHPAIPPVHDLGTLPDGRPFLAMKLIEGHTLDALLSDRENLTTNRSRFVAVFEQICQAVAFAQSHRIIHRDLKPANVMVGDFGEVQVMDWGLAKELDSAPRSEPTTHSVPRELPEEGKSTLTVGLQTTDHATDGRTQAGQIMGTPAYMPPEQARGETARVDCRSDVFALGGILCTVLTGKPPFIGNGATTLRKAIEGDVTEAVKRLDECSADAELVSLCKQCLAPEVDDRPDNAGMVADLVAEYRAGVEKRLRAAERKQAATEAKATEQRKRRRVQLALAATVILLLAGLGAFGWWQDRQARERIAEQERAENDKRLSEERIENEKRVAVERAENEKRALAFQQQLDDERRAADERTRLARNGEALGALVSRCEYHLRNGETEAAGSALMEAEKRMKEGGGEAVATRLARCQGDFRALLRLDAIDRFAWTQDKDGYPPKFLVVAHWRDAFSQVGITWGQTPAAEVAAIVKQSLISDRLLLALDSWLALEQSNWLVTVLHETDPDPFRDSVRSALRAADKNRLVELISGPEVEKQPARFMAAVGQMRAIPVERIRALLEIASRSRPNDLSILMSLGMSFDNANPEKIADRFRWYQAAVAAHPRNAAAQASLAFLLAHVGEKAGAIALYREAIRLDAKLTAAHNNLGNLLTEKNDLAGAATAYREVIKLDPKNAAPHFNLALVQIKQNDTDAALTSLREAIRLDPGLVQAHSELGATLVKKDDVNGAIAAYREAIRLDPNLNAARVNLGVQLSRIGKGDESIALYREAIKRDPKLAIAHHNLGVALKAKGDLDGTIAAYQEAVKLDPTLPHIHYYLGTALALKGNIDTAAKHFREAIQRDPTHAPSHFNLGVALVDLDDLDGALVNIKEAARLNPKDPVFVSAVGKVEAAIKKRGPRRDLAPPPREVNRAP